MSMISYYLRKNPLTTSDENQYMARVENRMTLGQEKIVELMMRKNTSLTHQDITGVLGLLKETVKEQILDGFSVNMDLFKASVGIRGGFAAADDEFDRNRHKVNLNLNAAAVFKKELVNSATVEKVRHKVRIACIDQIYDYSTKANGLSFPAGGLIEIYGDCLQSEGGDTRVALRPEGSDEMIPVPMVHSVTERTVLCNLPADVAAGDYRVYILFEEDGEEKRVKYSETVSIA